MGLAGPLTDCSRARAELGWEPRRGALDALRELIAGMRSGDDLDTPPQARGTSRPARVRVLLTGLRPRA
jgi:UDP-glucose 4-epimerase